MNCRQANGHLTKKTKKYESEHKINEATLKVFFK